MSNLTTKGLLQYRTIELNGEIEAIFDATIALERLDEILESQLQGEGTERALLREIHQGFGGNLPTRTGTTLTPLRLKTRTKTVHEDQTDPDVIKAALRRLSLTANLTGNISKPFYATGAVKASTV